MNIMLPATLTHYCKFYWKYFFPLYEWLMQRPRIIPRIQELLDNQWKSREQLENITLLRLKSLLIHAESNVPYYKSLFDEHGFCSNDLRSLKDIERLPVLNKEIINENKQSLISNTIEKGELIPSSTGGSTGTPLHFYHDRRNYVWRRAAIFRCYGWAGYIDGQRNALFWAVDRKRQSLLSRIKTDLHEKLQRILVFNSFHMDCQMMDRYASKLRAYRPRVIVGYASAIYGFARYIIENSIKLPEFDSVIVGAEKLYEEHRQDIETAFKCVVYNTYGCREVTSIAAECERHQGMHVNEDLLHVEVVNDDNIGVVGKEGRILITDLTNTAMPFIRYEVGDLGILDDKPCVCGRGLKRLSNVMGRTLDILRSTDGKMVPGEFFTRLSQKISSIKQYQVIQNKINNLKINIVPYGERLSASEREIIKNEVAEVFGKKMNIEICIVNKIQLTKMGKHRITIYQVE